MYAIWRPPKPGACKSAHFHAFVKHFVQGITMTLTHRKFRAWAVLATKRNSIGNKECSSCHGHRGREGTQEHQQSNQQEKFV